MNLPADEVEMLKGRGSDFTVSAEANMTCLVLKGFELPDGYETPSSDLLLRLSPGYPDVPPDMWWFNPPVQRKDGVPIPATTSIESYLGRQWQRWSRHLNPGQWRSGRDSLESYIALIRRDLEKHAGPQ